MVSEFDLLFEMFVSQHLFWNTENRTRYIAPNLFYLALFQNLAKSKIPPSGRSDVAM